MLFPDAPPVVHSILQIYIFQYSALTTLSSDFENFASYVISIALTFFPPELVYLSFLYFILFFSLYFFMWREESFFLFNGALYFRCYICFTADGGEVEAKVINILTGFIILSST